MMGPERKSHILSKKEKEITAYPLVMFRYVKNAPFQYDINGVIDWKKLVKFNSAF